MGLQFYEEMAMHVQSSLEQTALSFNRGRLPSVASIHLDCAFALIHGIDGQRRDDNVSPAVDTEHVAMATGFIIVIIGGNECEVYTIRGTITGAFVRVAKFIATGRCGLHVIMYERNGTMPIFK